MQGELLVLAAVAAAFPALVAVLLVSLALISLDGHSGLGTLALSVAAALGMVVIGTAVCTGLILLSRGLGRGSHRAWAATLAAAVLVAVLAGGVTTAWLAPQLSLSSKSAVLAAAPAALAALLLVVPPTLRPLLGARRRGSAKVIARDRPRAA